MSTPTRRRSTRIRLQRIWGEGAQARPLRVLFVSAAGVFGGAERSLVELLRALPREQIEPQACVPPDSVLAEQCTLAGLPTHPVPFRRFRRTVNPLVLAGQVRAIHHTAQRVAAVCREQRIELLHANTDTAALVAWETSRQTRLPFVWHCRDLRPLHGLARLLSRSAAAVVPISRAVESHLLSEGVRAEKLHRIDNGIDLGRMYSREHRAEIRAKMREKLGLGAQPVLLAVGAYVRWKNHELFLQALTQLASRCPSVVGLLAGSDRLGENADCARSLLQLAGPLQRNGTLKVLGERDDIPELMAAADVLVSCSRDEPFGRVVAEAGAAGLPVVATASGGKSEIVEDGVTGLLAPQDDLAALVGALERLVREPALGGEMGDRARRRIEQLFDIRRTAAELAALLQSLRAPER